MKRLALTIFTLALATVASAEQFYKWQDPSGSWHYSTQPPKDQQSQAVLVNTGPGRTVQTQDEPAAAPAAKPAEPRDPKSGEPMVANADTLKQMQEAGKAKAANCERAKANVATLESYTSVTVKRDGADVTLSDEERAAELKRARAQMDTFCK